MKSTLTQSAVIENLVGDSENSIYSRICAHLSSASPSLAPHQAVNVIFSELVHILYHGPHSASETIEELPSLLARANAIAKAANEAEHELEHFYTAILINKGLTRTHSSEILSTEARMSAIIRASHPFPYVGNYVRLVQAECQVLAECARDVQSIAVVGAGPLPLSGVLMAALLDVSVTLIDVDTRATELAHSLVERWEVANVIPRGKVHTLCADARDVRFSRGRNSNAVQADGILVCSLVPNDAKAELVRHVADEGWDGVIGVRSAHGLTALANYQRTNRRELSSLLDFVGYVVPVACIENGVVIGESEMPIAVFPRDVLNSIEIYTAPSDEQHVANRMRNAVFQRFGRKELQCDSLL